MSGNVSRFHGEAQTRLVNVANVLTVVRLVLVPVFVWLLAAPDPARRWWALAVFVAAASTDRLDGHLARTRGLVTDFGRIADPLADKALMLSAFTMLSIRGMLPWWFTAVVAVRELGITALRAVLLRRGIVVSASQAGKVKTALQMGLMAFMLPPWTAFAGGAVLEVVRVATWLWAAAALIATVWSGVAYCALAWRLRHRVADSSGEDARPEASRDERDGTEGPAGEREDPTQG